MLLYARILILDKKNHWSFIYFLYNVFYIFLADDGLEIQIRVDLFTRVARTEQIIMVHV